MLELVYLNARADECSAATIERGQRVMRHRGEEYIVIGLYFARGQEGQRELFYILRPLNGAFGS